MRRLVRDAGWHDERNVDVTQERHGVPVVGEGDSHDRTKRSPKQTAEKLYADIATNRSDVVIASATRAIEPCGAERLEQPRQCAGLDVDGAERFVVLAQLCESRLQQGQIAINCDILYRHVIEADDLHVQPVSGAMERGDDLCVRLAEFDRLVACNVDGLPHAKAEIPLWNKQRGTVFTDEGLIAAEFPLDELELRAGFAGTEHERKTFALDAVQCTVRRGVNSKRMGLEQRVVQVAKHQNRRHWLHVGANRSTTSVLATNAPTYPVGRVFSTLKPWRVAPNAMSPR
jgi:hypothetical protein